MFSTALQDVSFALRQFRRSPSFVVTAVLTLALGIGATTAIFSLVDGILLRPLPFPEADRLMGIATLEYPIGVAPTNLAAGDPVPTSYPDFFDWRRQTRTFESLASYDEIGRLFSKANGEDAQVIDGGRVSCESVFHARRASRPRSLLHHGRRTAGTSRRHSESRTLGIRLRFLAGCDRSDREDQR